MTARKNQFWQDNGLTLAMIALFVVSLMGQYFFGWREHNEELAQHGQASLDFVSYFFSGHFVEAVFENWESEFLQMAVFVILSACLYQRGSSESNPLPDQEDPTPKFQPRYFLNHPWLRYLYKKSLSIALLALFGLSFALHLLGSWKEMNVERSFPPHPLPPLRLSEVLFENGFWFESFQNWQSEFLSMAVIIVATIYLRQEGSAQSKPVDAPHDATDI